MTDAHKRNLLTRASGLHDVAKELVRQRPDLSMDNAVRLIVQSDLDTTLDWIGKIIMEKM